ncbi:unnamed protein product, partial [Iphiclides podalirius]
MTGVSNTNAKLALTITYDSYTGIPISQEDVKRHDKRNTTFWCTQQVEPCAPDEGRRIDGSCNNLRLPTRGAAHTPTYRVLPAVYGKDFEPRPSKSGHSLPLARFLRTSLMAVGRLPDQMFTTLLTNFLVFMTGDVLSLHDTVKFIAWKPYCCLPKGKKDRDCTPNKIPDDDPVHRFSDIRCLNMTRPESFQSIGCIKNDTVPERIVSATPAFDLSTVYGNTLKALMEKGRLFQRGLLKYEVENGRVWPPSVKTGGGVCFLNQRPLESRCHDTPEDGSNSLAGINLMTIWMWRHHNLIAAELAHINPCWSDDKLFYTARDINIAITMQIFYYELLPAVFGNYLKKVPIVNLTLRTGFFGVDDNMDYVTQSNFRQGAAKIDYIVDPDIVEVGMGPHQRATDLLTNDLAKNRYFGFPPYIKYRELCFKQSFKTFDDLLHAIDPERVELLKEVYENLEDVDLIAGIWLEKLIEGGHVPATLYCIVVDQLLRTVASDRHWYERPQRPNAFTFEQLQEIRKATVARLMCNVGDKVTRIQRHAFYRISTRNPLQDCERIEFVNLGAWKDERFKYVLWKPYCCTAKGKTDRDCVPNKIPDDDPVHRFSNIRCLNMTRPESFQSIGCVRPDTFPERIIGATPTFDVSSVYGNSLKALFEKGRKFEGGLLKYEVENGKIWPPSVKTPVSVCLLNQKPHETRCHDTPEDASNSVVGVNLAVIWFWRLHNRIATALARINPCWDDDRLFYTTRDIVIAIEMQIMMYELLPAFMGKSNLLRDGVITNNLGYRDLYNEDVIPQISLEFPSVLRWFHTVQSGSMKMYDAQGYFLKEIPIANLTLRTGFLAVDNNIDHMTQGSFRQASGKVDYAVDPEFGESSLGPHQKASDVFTNDLAKNRYFGFQPYVKYLELCTRRPYKKFEDLLYVMDPEKIEILQELYDNLEDVDLHSGLWTERFVGGGHVPSTLYCVVVEQMLRTIISDRHCNPIIGCNEIEGIDLWAWEDSNCINDGSFHGPDYKQKNQPI